MQYTAIVKNGGLFIPNIFTQADGNDSQPQVVQIDLDMAQLNRQLYEQLQTHEQAPNNINTSVQKVNLADLPIRAFDTITDPVAWQNTLREEW